MSTTINARITAKTDSATNWGKATNFTPLKGELIIYESESGTAAPRFKVGDGATKVGNLPFYSKTYV